MSKLNYGAGFSGAASGAATGASIGSVIPGVGTAIGTGIGAIAGGISGLFGSKKKKKKKVSTLDPQQQALYQDYVDSIRGTGPMSDLYNFDAEGANKNFDQNFSRPAYRNFEENVIPSITGQFRSGNVQNSSYMGEALGRAGRGVQEGLDAQRSSMMFQGQGQANQNKQNSIQNILGTQTFAYQKPGAQKPGAIDEILGSLGVSSGEWLADYLKKGNSGSASPNSPFSQSSYAANSAAFATR